MTLEQTCIPVLIVTKARGISLMKEESPGTYSAMKSRRPFPLARLPVLAAALLIGAAACSSEGQSTAGTATDPLALNLAQVYSTVTSISVQVAYEPDAEPFTGMSQGDTPYWGILQGNMEALFLGRAIEPAVFVPWDLSGMDPIPEQDEESWTSSEIIALARATWDQPMSESDAFVHILFLNGYFEDNGAANPKVLGVSYSGSSVITIFKDVVRASGSSAAVDRFVEQATLVHEAGHMLGLVDNGVPMVSGHLDPEHPRHCTNPDCVMYWLNEGAADLRDFIQQVIETDSLVLFGDECLEDVRQYAP